MNDNLCRHVCELEKLTPPPGPPPPQSSISQQQAHKQRQAWEEHQVLQGTKGCRLNYKKAMETMEYNFLALQFSSFNVSKGFLIQCFNGIMEGQIRAISSHMEGQETSDLDPHQGKLQKSLAFCTLPNVREFRGYIRVYMRERV